MIVRKKKKLKYVSNFAGPVDVRSLSELDDISNYITDSKELQEFLLKVYDLAFSSIHQNVLLDAATRAKLSCTASQIKSYMVTREHKLSVYITDGQARGWCELMYCCVSRAALVCVASEYFVKNKQVKAPKLSLSNESLSVLLPHCVLTPVCRDLEHAKLSEAWTALSALRAAWNSFDPSLSDMATALEEYLKVLDCKFSLLVTGRYRRDIMDDEFCYYVKETKPHENHPEFSCTDAFLNEWASSFVEMSRSIQIRKDMEVKKFHAACPSFPNAVHFEATVRGFQRWVEYYAISVASADSLKKDSQLIAQWLDIRPGEVSRYIKLNGFIDPDNLSAQDILSQERTGLQNSAMMQEFKTAGVIDMIKSSWMPLANGARIKAIKTFFQMSCRWNWERENLVWEDGFYSDDTQKKLNCRLEPYVMKLMGGFCTCFNTNCGIMFADFAHAFVAWVFLIVFHCQGSFTSIDGAKDLMWLQDYLTLWNDISMMPENADITALLVVSDEPDYLKDARFSYA